MKLYAPKYYKDFKCIADKCEHSCCIGWEIDVDGEALKKYEGLSGRYGDAIRGSISYDGEPHFKLCDGDRCPHLNDEGLCKIIIALGEDCLCSICREHPRFYNFTEVAEVGIGMSCPEAARVILSSPHYYISEDVGSFPADESEPDFDGRAERSRIYGILRDGSMHYAARLERIASEYGVTTDEDALWLKKIDSLEYLDEEHRKLFMKYSSKSRPKGADEYLERFFAYLVYRHCTEAADAEDLRDRLGFCLFCERLLASLVLCQGAETMQDVATLASIISEEIEYSDDNTLSLTYR